jgi:hypothetical protein
MEITEGIIFIIAIPMVYDQVRIVKLFLPDETHFTITHRDDIKESTAPRPAHVAHFLSMRLDSLMPPTGPICPWIILAMHWDI